MTIINAINASGTALPPMLFFLPVNYRERFIRGAPVGSIGAVTRSGWVNEETFVQHLDHFIHHTGCTVDRKVLLILDNHKAHVSLAAVDKAQANGIVLLTIPPYTSHNLQPLDVTVHGPYKKAYARAMDAWMRFNPKRTVSIYDVLEIVNKGHTSACVPRNILAGFRSTGIRPFNHSIFLDIEYAPASVTERKNDQGMPPLDLPVSADVSLSLPSMNSNEAIETLPLTYPGEITTNSAQSLPSDQASSSSTYVSLMNRVPLPKAWPRKQKVRRKKGCSRVMTCTPIRNKVAVENQARKIKQSKDHVSVKKRLFSMPLSKNQSKSTTLSSLASSSKASGKQLCVKTTLVSFVSSSSEEDNSIPSLHSDSESCYDSEDEESVEDPPVTNLNIDDFVIVKVFLKAQNSRNFIAQISCGPDEDDNYEVRFLKRSLKIKKSFFLSRS